MNYILRESNDGKHLVIREDKSGKILNTQTDVGDEIKVIEAGNRFAYYFKDVIISSNKDKLIEKAKEIVEEYSELELKIWWLFDREGGRFLWIIYLNLRTGIMKLYY